MVNTTLIGMSKSDFNDVARAAFKLSIASLIPGVRPSDVNISDIVEMNTRRRRLTGYLRNRGKYLMLVNLQINWQLRVVLEEYFETSMSNSSHIDQFANVLTDALSNSTNFLDTLQNSAGSSGVFLTLTSIEPPSIYFDRLAMIAKSSYPTSCPSSQPTVIWENVKISSIQRNVTSTSQFMWLMAMVIVVFFSIPWFIRAYIRRGQKKANELASRLSLLRFNANKSKLSEVERRRRDEYRSAFRAKFGKDINVYADCADEMKSQSASNVAINQASTRKSSKGLAVDQKKFDRTPAVMQLAMRKPITFSSTSEMEDVKPSTLVQVKRHDHEIDRNEGIRSIAKSSLHKERSVLFRPRSIPP